eukprot:IDg21543t1
MVTQLGVLSYALVSIVRATSDVCEHGRPIEGSPLKRTFWRSPIGQRICTASSTEAMRTISSRSSSTYGVGRCYRYPPWLVGIMDRSLVPFGRSST